MKGKSVKEINEIIETLDASQYLQYIDILKNDERKSVKNIALKLAKKLDKIRLENERCHLMTPNKRK